MAKKKYSRRMKKIEPAELSMTFTLPALDATYPTYRPTIDLSQCASLLNRRFYRQGLNWAVSGFTLHTSQFNTGTLTISKLPNTWVMSNAWEKGFRVWQRMNNEALEENESVRPRFLDFKIYANNQHHDQGFDDNMRPFIYLNTGARSTATAGEWESSKIVIPQGQGAFEGTVASSEFIAVGASWPGVSTATGKNAVSLIEGYASSRALPNIADPNMPDDLDDTTGTNPENWMTAVFNEGTQQDQFVLDDMQQENNVAPYPFENDGVSADTMYPGGANQVPGLVFHDRMNVTPTTVSGKTHAVGGNFPCGLIQLNYPEAMEDAVLQIHLVPGDHRGYLCEPMTEM